MVYLFYLPEPFAETSFEHEVPPSLGMMFVGVNEIVVRPLPALHARLTAVAAETPWVVKSAHGDVVGAEVLEDVFRVPMPNWPKNPLLVA